MARRGVMMVVLLVAGCLQPVGQRHNSWDASSPGAQPDLRDAGPACANPCGSDCCAPTEACLLAEGRCCAPRCGGRQCGPDGCGGTCGSCTAPLACTAAGQCTCTPDCAGRACGPDGCGGSCGGCPDGLACDGSGRCSACSCVGRECGDDGCGHVCGFCPPMLGCSRNGICIACDPVCLSGQRCDTKQVPPACIEMCNPPKGCRPIWEVCNEGVGQCEPLRCAGSPCDFGQGCFDPATQLAANTCTCLPDRRGAYGARQNDTCEAYGKVCGAVPGRPAPARCRLPLDGEECDPAIGCGEGLDCISFAGKSTCLRRCAAASQCPLPSDTCIAERQDPIPEQVRGHCWWNVCAYPALDPRARAAFFQPCDAQGTADGLCLPVSSEQTGVPGDLGVCVQAGSAPANGRCSASARRPNLAAMCPAGQVCDPVQPDAAGGIAGICRPVCNPGETPDPVQSCDAQTLCIDLAPALGPGVSDSARLGVCRPSCNMLGAARCAADALGNGTSCFQGPGWDGRGWCRAVLPGAAGSGASCSYAPDDPRNPCASQLFCLEETSPGKCVSTCDTRACPPTKPCASCQPAGATCVKMGADYRLGYCRP